MNEVNSLKMLTVKEVANILHVHPNTLRNWCDKGIIKAYHVGPRGDRRFLPEDIETFLASYQKQNQVSGPASSTYTDSE